MKKANFKIVFSIILIITSCVKKNCNCTVTWDSSITYVKNDLVSYNQKCWIAQGQGKGIEPGPWLQNSNDIWVECSD